MPVIVIGSRFEQGIRDYVGVPPAPRWRRIVDRLPRPIARFLAARDRTLVNADPVKRMHYEFASTTQKRGDETLELITARRTVKGASVLDIGCAYGGFLVAAARCGAARVVGLDISAKLIELARINVGENAAGDRVRVVHGDALDDTVAASLGRFDVIICNDVIEHVASPEALVNRIAGLLEPGGLAFLEIPNRRSSRYMASDGHFQIFGITALEHEDAEALYRCHYPKDEYSVGHLYDLQRYVDLFEALGCRVDNVAYPRAATSVAICEADYRAFEEKLRAYDDARVPAALADKLRRAAGEFCEAAWSDLATHRSGAMSEDAFLLRNYDPFWRVFVSRPAIT